VPDPNPDRKLDQLLGFHESLPSEEFVLEVMHRVQREQRSRKLILTLFGLAGAAFGLAGAVLLSNPIAQLFSNLPLTNTMQAVLFAVAAVAFYGWLMNEDVSIDI
jgi:uncharacterized protein YacL